MAKCSQCGGKADRNSNGMCASCWQRYSEHQAAAAAAQLAEQRRVYDSEVETHVAWAISQIDSVTAAGGTAHLYRWMHLDVDSMMDASEAAQGLDLFEMNMLGAAGWEIVATVPRTYSGSQTYVAKGRASLASAMYGVGVPHNSVQKVSLSGNVVGAYLLLRLEISSATRVFQERTIRETVSLTVQQRMGPRPGDA